MSHFFHFSLIYLGAAIETIFSILELHPFGLVEVEGVHLDNVHVKVKSGILGPRSPYDHMIY